VYNYSIHLWHLRESPFQVPCFLQKNNETCWMAEQTASKLLAPQYTTDKPGQAFMPQTVTNSRLKATSYSVFLRPFPVTHLREISNGSDFDVITVHNPYCCTVHIVELLKPLTPNDHYSGRTASLTSKLFILYIYSTNMGNILKMVYTLRFLFLFKMQFVS